VKGAATRPVLAGLVAPLVGFASTFTVVLAGLRAVGATQAEAASGLLALCVVMGAVTIGLSLWLRMPIMLAWSTPGAALLVSAGSVDGGYAAAVGAFLVCGLLLTLAGFWGTLGRWIAAIPPALAAAMLAGVLLPLCVTPVRSLADEPALTAPVILVWALLTRFARRWAVPGALAAAIVAVAIDHDGGGTDAALLPGLTFTAPAFSVEALVGIAIPLFVVTMASQNIPGMTVLATYGYRPRLGPLLRATGAATAAGAPFGGFAINLAAITAALCAGPDADPDPGRRWIATVSAGAFYLVLGLCVGLAVALIALAPPLLIEAVAGLALLGALGGALAVAAADAERREAAVVTFAVSASGIALLGISAPFWGLVAGLAYLLLTRGRRRLRFSIRSSATRHASVSPSEHSLRAHAPTLAGTFARPSAATMRAVSDAISAAAASVLMTPNSSPPSRATVSSRRISARSVRAQVRSRRSPASWPRVSLIDFRPSTSMMTTTLGVPWRSERASSRSIAWSHPRRLSSSVSGSVVDSRSASARAASRVATRSSSARVVMKRGGMVALLTNIRYPVHRGWGFGRGASGMPATPP
jgi:benzoate membrane transport protein